VIISCFLLSLHVPAFSSLDFLCSSRFILTDKDSHHLSEPVLPFSVDLVWLVVLMQGSKRAMACAIVRNSGGWDGNTERL
jgi:hypothetical protein